MRAGPRRSILHVDLDAFFVGVERSFDPTLRGQPVVVGGDGRSGVVAAASSEARAAGVRAGMSLAAARRACPQAVLKPGDLDAYARVSEQVTGILLAESRRVERPSADEAYVDLTAERPAGVAPVHAAERIKDELQRRLGLDASLGLASSRLAARVASGWARPRGLLIVLPGYEASFLARQPVSALEGLPPHVEAALERAGLVCLGDILAAPAGQLRETLGAAAEAVRRAASGEGDEPIAVAAPPAWLQEEATVRDARTDRQGLETMLRGLADRICRRLRPYGLRAESLAVEVRRAGKTARRVAEIPGGVADENGCLEVARPLAAALLDPASGVQGLSLRLSRLTKGPAQAPLFPERPGLAGRR